MSRSLIDTSPGANAGWLLEEYPCPYCGHEICHLSKYGRCPVCGVMIAGRFAGLLGETWVPEPLDDAERRALLRVTSFKLVQELAWIDL